MAFPSVSVLGRKYTSGTSCIPQHLLMALICIYKCHLVYVPTNIYGYNGNVARTEASYPFSRKVNDRWACKTPNGSGRERFIRASTIVHTDETRDARGVIGNAAFNVRGQTKLPEDYKAAGVPRAD